MVTKELGQEQIAGSNSLFKNVPGAAQPQVTVQGLSRYATRGLDRERSATACPSGPAPTSTSAISSGSRPSAASAAVA